MEESLQHASKNRQNLARIIPLEDTNALKALVIGSYCAQFVHASLLSFW
jgi:hypothetical protein